MHKTLHKKLTEKYLFCGHSHIIACPNDDRLLTSSMHDTNLMREVAKDLLQPRPQAIANLLKMAREI